MCEKSTPPELRRAWALSRNGGQRLHKRIPGKALSGTLPLISLCPAERDYLEVLTDLIAKYESKWDDECAEMSPRELIVYLMEQNSLAQKDLVPEFGSPSRVSEFLKGERRLSLVQAKRLAERFRLNIAALIDKADSLGPAG